MDKPETPNKIPELCDLLAKYGVSISDEPPYILVGSFNSKKIGVVKGIIACCTNEFYAHLLKRELNKKKIGKVAIERTEFHPDGPTFHLRAYVKKVKELREKRKLEQAQQEEADNNVK